MKKKLTIIILFFALYAKSQSLYFPPTTGTTWKTLSPASLGWCQDKIDTLINYLGRNNTKAFIILKDGKIVVEHYFGTFTQDSAWYWASAGKSLTAFAVGLAQQDGFLSIDSMTSDYLGKGWTTCPLAKEKLITVRNQLTMTSGLNDGVPDKTCTTNTCLQYLADAGTRWAYHNAPYTILDSVIYYSTGQSINSYVTQKIKTPTGMSGLYLPSGYDNVYYSKPRSMARYGLLILNKGIWDTDTIMHDTNYFNQMVNTSQNINHAYGYLWWLNGKASYHLPSTQFQFTGFLEPHAPADMFSALGKNDQILNIVPSMSLVTVRMGNAFDLSLPVGNAVNDSIWVRLNGVFCNSTTSFNGISSEVKNISVFPNPASETLNINFPDNKKYSLTIYNNQGKSIYSIETTSNIKLETANFAEGIYFLRATNRKDIFNKKIIITR